MPAPGGCGPTPPAAAAAAAGCRCRRPCCLSCGARPSRHDDAGQPRAPRRLQCLRAWQPRILRPLQPNGSLSRLTQASQSSRIMLGSLDDGGGHALHAAPLHTVNSSQVRGRAPRLCCVAALATRVLPAPSFCRTITAATAGAGPRLASQALPPELSRLPPLLLLRHLLLRLPDVQPATSCVPLRRSQSQQHRHVPTPLPSDTEPWNPDDEPSTGPSAGCSSSAATAAAAAATTSSSPVSTSDAGERAADFAAANILISLPSSAEHDPEEEGVGGERRSCCPGV